MSLSEKNRGKSKTQTGHIVPKKSVVFRKRLKNVDKQRYLSSYGTIV